MTMSQNQYSLIDPFWLLTWNIKPRIQFFGPLFDFIINPITIRTLFFLLSMNISFYSYNLDVTHSYESDPIHGLSLIFKRVMRLVFEYLFI